MIETIKNNLRSVISGWGKKKEKDSDDEEAVLRRDEAVKIVDDSRTILIVFKRPERKNIILDELSQNINRKTTRIGPRLSDREKTILIKLAVEGNHLLIFDDLFFLKEADEKIVKSHKPVVVVSQCLAFLNAKACEMFDLVFLIDCMSSGETTMVYDRFYLDRMGYSKRTWEECVNKNISGVTCLVLDLRKGAAYWHNL